MGWAAWKLKFFFFSHFWVLLDLVRSEIAMKQFFEAYKGHRMALEVSKVNPAWPEKTQFYLVILDNLACHKKQQGLARVPYLILGHITCLLDGRKECMAVCMHISGKSAYFWTSNTV